MYSSVSINLEVEKIRISDVNDIINVEVPTGSLNPVFSIDLPDATGDLTVKIGTKTYVKSLVDGSAGITVDGLNPGSYNAVIIYSGDDTYENISINTAFTVPTPKLTAKNIAVIYSGSASYNVLVTSNGIALAGVKVSVKFNGKTYNVKTDKNGYATLKLNTNLKVNKYTITSEFKGVKISHKLTINHVIYAKNLKAKKSAKILKIKVTLKKVNNKYLIAKKVTLKFKGKTYKVSTNKKGVAIFNIKKNVLKKLKVGKKYKYKVTYGKDTMTKIISIRR